MAKELKGPLARSGTHGRAEHGVDCSFKWNSDKHKQNLDECTELDHDTHGSGDEEDKDDCSRQNQSRGSHIIDLDKQFLFIESNFCCRICASSGDSCVLDMSHAAAGMATSITFSCRCDLLDKRRKRHTESLAPEIQFNSTQRLHS
jgi:hypothetical protein